MDLRRGVGASTPGSTGSRATWPAAQRVGGQARDAYAVAKASWDRAILEMQQVLAQTSTAVTESNAAYAQTDRAAASGFHR